MYAATCYSERNQRKLIQKVRSGGARVMLTIDLLCVRHETREFICFLYIY